MFCKDDARKRNLKVFRFNPDGGVSSLDPAFARNIVNIWAATQLYNGLVELDSNMKVVPAIAKQYTVSRDGLKYVFRLRSDVYFHDNEVFADGKGRLVTAPDFVYSFKRIISKNTASPGAWIFNDKLMTDSAGKISDTCFVAQNDSTLIIYLEKPFPPFLQLLSMNYASVVPYEAVEKWGKDFRVHPVGTGPFVFKLWDEASKIILVKNENYWKTGAKGEKLPYIDAVEIGFINDMNVAFMTFLRGDLDFFSGIIENSKDKILNMDGSIKPEFLVKYNVQKVPYMNTEYVGFQLDTAFYMDKNHPFLNKNFRKALSYSIRRKELVQYLRNKLGFEGNSGFVPNSLPSFDSIEVSGYPYNIEKAVYYLEKSNYKKYKDHFTLKLSTVATLKDIAEFLQKEWSKIGVDIEIDINQAATQRELTDKGEIKFFKSSWVGDYPDAENYLALFYSKNYSPAGPNKFHYYNQKYDMLYENALEEQDISVRHNIYKQMEKIVMDDAPLIVLYYDQIIRITQKNIIGFKANAMNTVILENTDIIKKNNTHEK
ncbi:MAG: ABC transporter substrate-binding protein [Cytophagales bacterium]|nr:ABC transporter substrate-binding protein [Cytophagales bacterium]